MDKKHFLDICASKLNSFLSLVDLIRGKTVYSEN